MTNLNALAYEIYLNAAAKGFHGPEKQRAMQQGDVSEASHLQALAAIPEDRNFGEVLMLIVSEAAEALEDWRDGLDIAKLSYQVKVNLHSHLEEIEGFNANTATSLRDIAETQGGRAHLRSAGVDVKPIGVASELADIIIRVLDACGAYGVDIDTAIQEKMLHNATRPPLHGRSR